MASIDRTAVQAGGVGAGAGGAFTPTSDEVEWARSKTTTEQHFLALVVWLKCYQRLGYLPKLFDVPTVVVAHVRGKLGLVEEVAAEADAERTGNGVGSLCGSGWSEVRAGRRA